MTEGLTYFADLDIEQVGRLSWRYELRMWFTLPYRSPDREGVVLTRDGAIKRAKRIDRREARRFASKEKIA